MLICQEKRDLQDENRALAIPGGFQVDKDIAMSSGQLSQVRNSFNTTLDMICYQQSLICRYNAIIKQMFSSNLFLEKWFSPEIKILIGKFKIAFHST